MLTVLVALALQVTEPVITEADYRDAVTCTAQTRVAETWADGSDSLGERMLAPAYKVRAEALTGYAYVFGEYGTLTDPEVDRDIDAARTEANAAVMASQTMAELRTAKREVFLAADSCAETLMRFDAALNRHDQAAQD